MESRAGRSLTSVFINCPFTEDYASLFEAMTFTVLACGYLPRSALEKGDSGEVRMDKITRLIKASLYRAERTRCSIEMPAKKKTYPIQDFPTPGALLTSAQRAAAMEAALALIDAQGPLVAKKYPRLRITEAPNKR